MENIFRNQIFNESDQLKGQTEEKEFKKGRRWLYAGVSRKGSIEEGVQ